MKRKIVFNCFFLHFILLFLKANSQLVNHNRDLFDVFNPIFGYDIAASNITNNLIKSQSTSLRHDCARECSLNANCMLILHKNNQCNLYRMVDYQNFVISAGSNFLMAKQIDDLSDINANLIHHWPFNNNLNDIVGGKHMLNGISFSYTNDRLNTPSSAVFLNNGYIQAADGVYFNGDFTISVWVKISSHRYCSRVIDFGGEVRMDNVCFGLAAFSNELWFASRNNGQYITNNRLSTIALRLGVWQHLALTLNGINANYYVNGVSVFSATTISPRGVVRTGNYLGKSNWLEANSNPIAEFDDLKIFNRSLTQSELIRVLNSYY